MDNLKQIQRDSQKLEENQQQQALGQKVSTKCKWRLYGKRARVRELRLTTLTAQQ